MEIPGEMIREKPMVFKEIDVITPTKFNRYCKLHFSSFYVQTETVGLYVLWKKCLHVHTIIYFVADIKVFLIDLLCHHESILFVYSLFCQGKVHYYAVVNY